MNSKKFLHVFMCALVMVSLFSCKNADQNEPDNPEGNSTTQTGQSGLYLGILGFNKDYKTYAIQRLIQSTKSDCKSWIDALSIANNTDLYYAEWAALNMLQEFKAPSDLENASIITFTDGLDRGSYYKIEQFKNDGNNTNLIAKIQERLKNDKVNNVSLSAYSIGVRGSDVNDDKVAEFKATLKSLVVDPNNAYQVSNMQEVEARFKAIADDLHKVNTISDVILKSVRYNDGTYVGWTFDLEESVDKWNVGVSGVPTSKRYITGKLNIKGGKWSISDIKYDGLVYDSNGATTLEGVYEDDTEMIRFEFKNVRDNAGNAITDISILRQWNRDDESKNWGPESEFNRNNIPTPDVKDKSAVVILVLDCSSSLGDNGLAQLKTAAKNFIDIISSGNNGGSGSNPGGGDNPGNNTEPEEAYYIKHSWGTGQDADWEWREMTKEGNNYIYNGYWGGVGANINTIASDAGAEWYPQSEISGASSLSIGDGVKFTYNPSNGTLSAIKTSSGGGGSSKAKVRFRKEYAYTYVTEMSIEQVPGGGTGTFVTAASYTFGEEAGTTSYYEINAQVSYPEYYNAYYNEYQFALGDENPEYIFEGGKKYTYSCGDDGEYLVFSISIDGSYNTPSKIVASKRILKSKF